MVGRDTVSPPAPALGPNKKMGYVKGARRKDKMAYTPSQCPKEKYTRALGFMDEMTKSEFCSYWYYAWF